MKGGVVLRIVLEACLERPATCYEVHTQRGLQASTTSKTMSNARALGFLENINFAKCPRGLLLYSITAKGMAKLAEMRGAPAENLASRALALIMQSTTGLSSYELGEELDSEEAEIDAALAMHVAMQTLVSCKVQRSHGTGKLLQLTLYRNSTVGVPLVQISTPAQRGEREPVPPVPPVSESQAVRDMINAACDVLTTTTPPPEPFLAPMLKLPLVDDVGMDAVHRKFPPDEGAASSSASGFTCALYNDGILVIESDGVEVQLPLAHTTKLLHYLDHLRAGDLVTGLKEVL